MSVPSSRIHDYLEDRRHAGRMVDATALGKSSFGGQPPHSTIYLRIADSIVREGRFETSGCGFLFACCAAAIELARDRQLADCLGITPAEIVNHLGGLPEARLYCAELAVVALQDALATSSCPRPLPTSE